MISFFITFNCNLRCKYCYLLNELKAEEITLKESTFLKFLDFMDYLNHFSPLNTPERIMFIGGEPTLYPELVIRYMNILKQRYPKVKFQFEITTNLTLMNKKILKLFRNDELHFFVSLDGLKETHDKNRVFPNGDGSYDTVIKNLKILSKYKKRISIVFTFLPDDKIDFVAFIRSLTKLNPKVFWEIEARPAMFTLNNSNWLKVLGAYKEVIKIYDKERFSFASIEAAIETKKFLEKNEVIKTCSVGFSLFRLHPNGDIWPCSGYFAIKKRRFGNIYTDSFDDIKRNVVKLQMLNVIARNRMQSKKCNCKAESICYKPPCIALYERNKFKCNENSRLSKVITYSLVKLI